MTRETKVGLVVSGSFLCLVGAVLAIKLNGGGGGDAAEEGQAADAGKQTPALKLSPPADDKKASEPAPSSPEFSLPPTPAKAPETKREGSPPSPPAQEQPDSTQVATNIPDPKGMRGGQAQAKSADRSWLLPELPPETTPGAAASTAKTPAPEKGTPSSPFVGPLPRDSEPTLPAPEQKNKDTAKPGPMPVEDEAGKPPLVPPPTKEKDRGDTAPPPAPDRPAPDGPASSHAGLQMPPPSEVIGDKGNKKESPAPDPLPLQKNDKRDEPPTVKVGLIELPPPPDAPRLPSQREREPAVNLRPEPVDGGKPDKPEPRKSVSPFDDPAPAGDRKAQLGTPVVTPPNDPAPKATAGTPAPIRPVASVGNPPPGSRGTVQPAVESWTEVIYTCQPGDTFPAIAAKFYNGADRYAAALLWHNRNHPNAGDGVKQEPPVLKGQQVYVPDVKVLERRYPSLVPGLTDAPGGAAAPSQPRYRVAQPNGEMVYDIARRTLGDGNRWQEIARLNALRDPQLPLPRDMVLRLPPDARVEPLNQPR